GSARGRDGRHNVLTRQSNRRPTAEWMLPARSLLTRWCATGLLPRFSRHLTMRLPFPHVLALALGLASGTGAAGAQDVTRERVQAELDRTDQRIEQSEMVVSSSNNEIAETALND